MMSFLRWACWKPSHGLGRVRRRLSERRRAKTSMLSTRTGSRVPVRKPSRETSSQVFHDSSLLWMRPSMPFSISTNNP